jgi:hypothetical protein
VKTRTSGLEATVTATPFKNANGFSWNILANWSQYRQVFAEFPEGTDVLYNFYKVGDRTDGYYDSGVFHTPEGEIINDASGRPLRNPIPQFLGYSNPDWVWGITNRFGWKSLSLTVQFDGRVGGVLTNYIQRQTFRGGRHIATTEGAMGIARENDTKGIKSYLGEGVQISNGVPIQYDPQTGAITNYSELTYTANATPAYLQDYIGRYYATSEANLMSKTFSKLREVTLTYTVPTRALGNSFIRGASVSFVSRNLLYFAEKKDIDIDQYIGSNYSGLQTPTVKSFGANVNLTF